MRLTMPDAGRISLAKTIKDNSAIYVALGRGDDLWGNSPPSIDPADAALEDPFAILRPSQVSYVQPGTAFETSEGSQWDIVTGPTKYLYVVGSLGYSDASGETIRELALYFDSVLSSPGGQSYSDYDTEVTSVGSLLGLKRFAPIIRTASLHDFGEIITF